MNTRLPVDLTREHTYTPEQEEEILRLVRAAYTLGYTAAEVDNWIPNP